MGKSRLTVRNRRSLRKFNLPGCKPLNNIPCPRKANIPLHKCVFSGNDEKRDFKKNDAVPCSQNVINGKAGDNNKAIFATHNHLSPEDSSSMDAGQSSAKLRNAILSRLDRYNKPVFSKIDFVDDGVSPENELRCSGRV